MSIDIPKGWKIDKHNSHVFYKDDYNGIVIDELLEGKNFEEYVDKLCKDFNGKILSKQPLIVSGYDAIDAIIEYPNSGNKAFNIYIQKGDKLIEVSYVIKISDFQKYEQALRKSFDSIEIK